MSTAPLPTVMIVDDDRINRTLLAELLHKECRVVLAKDGPSALTRIREESEIDLILLDVSMPGMDGYEVLRRMHTERRSRDIAVVFITASTETGDEEYGLSLGALDYLHKPIRPAIVRARVRNHLKLIAQRKELERLAERDDLTGINNRRYFDRAFGLAWRHASRIGEPLGLAMIDVDHFKQYNDRHGHAAGDEALREIAQILAGSARRTYDVAARYGGEEFVLMLPGVTDLETVLEQARHEIAGLQLPRGDPEHRTALTVSCGGVIADVHDGFDPPLLLRHADALLYEAKRQGRNRMLVRRCSGLEALPESSA